MELIPIFTDQNKEGLYSVHFDGENADEFTRLFDMWNDTEFVTEYCVANEDYLKTAFHKFIPIDKAIDKVLNEAEELEQLLYDYSDSGFQNEGKNLGILFRALSNNQHSMPALQKTKAKVIDRNFRDPVLRIYAIRLGPNTFVVTGGAIKLTHFMEDHPDTTTELQKIDRVKTWLTQKGIQTEDDLNYYYEQPE